ncbi:MAG TPA: hydroxysqualene dehydroxylase HpnE [Acidimicrobiales bacterium]|nr:hydroxysqualene dehydroxylase HpnE [Acidimicrobiales bacterium]
MSAPRVGIVGGGLAGMSCALACADAGLDVTLLESRRRLGGLTWSFERHGRWFDNGQHVFLRCCQEYIDFVARIGATSLVTMQDRLDVPVLAPGRAGRLRRDPLPAPLHLARALAGYSHLSVPRRARLVPAALALSRLDPEDPTLDGQAFGDWLARHGQSEAAIETLWDLIARPTINLPAREASLALAVKVFRTGLLDRADAADIGWSAVPLGHLHGGKGGDAMTAAGVDVRLGVPVAGVAGGACPQIRTADGATMPFDAVVVAVDPSSAVRLLPEGLPARDGAGRLGSSAIIDVGLVLDRRVTDLPVAAVLVDPPLWVFDRTDAAGVRRPGQCLAVSISAAGALVAARPEKVVADVTDRLARVIPAVASARVVDAVVTKERNATFSGVPGSTRLRPRPGRVTEGLHLAGAWTATGWPATMEGAVRSGRAAARDAISELMSDRPSPQEALA